jgi:hypothetical protein
MQWSKLKSLVEARFAPALRRRVSLHQARYRYAREEVGRVWLMVDGRDAASFATGAVRPAVRAEADRLVDEREAGGTPTAYADASAEAEETVRAAGVYDDAGALAELEAFLSLPIDEALGAARPLLRALAVLDARVGKRRLRALAAGPDEHPLVRTLLALRCDAEGVRPPAPPAV